MVTLDGAPSATSRTASRSACAQHEATIAGGRLDAAPRHRIGIGREGKSALARFGCWGYVPTVPKRMLLQFGERGFPSYDWVDEQGVPQPCALGVPWSTRIRSGRSPGCAFRAPIRGVDRFRSSSQKRNGRPGRRVSRRFHAQSLEYGPVDRRVCEVLQAALMISGAAAGPGTRVVIRCRGQSPNNFRRAACEVATTAECFRRRGQFDDAIAGPASSW